MALIVVQAIQLLVFGTLIMLALIGNAMVCMAIYWDRHLRRQAENLFLVSLAASDLLVSVLVMIFAAANDILGHWPFGVVYCRLWICLDIMCCTCSILNLCAIALDRYWHISKPMAYLRVMNRRRIVYIIVAVWLLSAAIGFGQLTFAPELNGDVIQQQQRQPLPTNNSNPMVGRIFSTNHHRQQQQQRHSPTTMTVTNQPLTTIAPNRCYLDLKPLYAIVSSSLSFFIPALIMVLLYTRLYIFARSHAKTIKSQFKACSSMLFAHCDAIRSFSIQHSEISSKETGAPINSSKLTVNGRPRGGSGCSATLSHCSRAPSPGPGSTPSKQFASKIDSSKIASDQKARITLGVIMGTFMLCWSPFFICNVIRPFYPESISPLLFHLVTWLGYANSGANPIIYSIFNRDFRRAFNKILTYCCRWCLKSANVASTNRVPTIVTESAAPRSNSFSTSPTHGNRVLQLISSGHRSNSLKALWETEVVRDGDGACQTLLINNDPMNTSIVSAF